MLALSERQLINEVDLEGVADIEASRSLVEAQVTESGGRAVDHAARRCAIRQGLGEDIARLDGQTRSHAPAVLDLAGIIERLAPVGYQIGSAAGHRWVDDEQVGRISRRHQASHIGGIGVDHVGQRTRAVLADIRGV